MHLPSPAVRGLTTVSAAQLDELAELLIDCVDGGASVSFMQPLTRPRAIAFWRGVAAEAELGQRVLLVAEDELGIVGTVQVVLAQPENQPHRADVSKMLVLRRARRRGIGAALMKAAEDAARQHGKTLLVLDTASADAERLYAQPRLAALRRDPGLCLAAAGRPVRHDLLLSPARCLSRAARADR